MKRFASLVLGILAVCASPSLRSDGMVVQEIGYAKMQIPDQRALIHYTNGVERLVIETSFVGPGTNFAWVVPLPSVPSVEPVSTAVFSTLQVGFQPQVILKVEPHWLAAALIGFVAWLMRLVQRRRVSFPTLCLILLLLGVLLLGMILPAAATKAAATGPLLGSLSNVRVLQRQRVGVFDTFTLSSRDPAALTSWLNSHGFATPTNAGPVIADYVKEGWVFVAARVVRSTNTAEPTSPHPLSFTFRTREPVYPLRLTGLDHGPCSIDLYVFGPQRAEVAGFRATRCARPSYRETFARPRVPNGALRVRQEELTALVVGAPVATRLTARLSPGQMKRDAYLRWVPYRSQGATLYTSGAALTRAANVASFLALLSPLIAWFGCRRFARRPLSPDWFPKLVTFSVGVGAGVFLLTPRAAVGDIRISRVRHRDEAHMLAWCLKMAIEDHALATNVDRLDLREPSSEALSRLVNELGPYYRDDGRDPHPVTNSITGQPIRLEKSPGNIWVAPGTNGLRMIWFDFDGAPGFTNELF